MLSSKSKSLFYSVVSVTLMIVVLLSLWEIFISTALYAQTYFSLTSLNNSWKQFLALIALGIVVGILTEKISLKKILPAALLFLLIYSIVNALSIIYWSVNLLFIRVCFVTIIALVFVHAKKLWQIDSELTERLVNLSSTGHFLEIKSADLRIESGLKLLETVLPLSEAIVFRLDNAKNLTPVGRARNSDSEDSSISRQSAWRENVQFCEQAVLQKQTIVEQDKENKTGAQIALPLIYEKNIVGVLFVKVRQNFERSDQYLLESFSEQLAQNFQRKELRSKSLPHKFWWSFLSTESAENRLGITSLIGSLMKEQTFSTVASSYLKEAHAIAYLDGTLAYLNRQMRHLIKLNSYEIHELDLFSLLDNFKTEIFYEPRMAIRRVLQTGETFQRELFFSKSNKTLDMQITLVKVPGDDQSIHETNIPMKPACFLITFRDITAVKENEKLRSDMTSLMSHELRTPVTSIKGFTELLMMDEAMSEESREFLTIISNESDRLSKMLATFLSVSNLEQSDKKDFIKSPVKLDTVVHEVIGDLQDTARRKCIRLVEKSPTIIPPIAADKGLISRAVSHLIDNAIKYSPEKTSVIVSTILESEFLRVVVEDRGYGIPKSEQEKIWQKFYRVARDGQDKEEESTGLGLSLVKEIVEQHGGSVEVESETGGGSKFSFVLPRL